MLAMANMMLIDRPFWKACIKYRVLRRPLQSVFFTTLSESVQRSAIRG
jgi:hypothetical protein